ncbi:MAG: EI24 domain-containing protein, partial [Bdellovibrionia bacterium]
PWTTPPLSPVEKQGWGSQFKLLGIDLMKSMAATFSTGMLFLFALFPGLNLLALVFSSLLMTFQYLSYPQTRRGETLSDGLRFLWRHFLPCLGLGMTLIFLFSIPLLSSFTLPLAVVSGTLLYGNQQRPKAQSL